jgi:hypothetical protein
MKKISTKKGWRAVAAWILAVTLAVGLTPSAAFAAPEKSTEVAAGIVGPVKSLTQEPFAQNESLSSLADSQKGFLSAQVEFDPVPQATIDASTVGTISTKGTTSLYAGPKSIRYYKFTISRPAKINMAFKDLNTNVDAYTSRPALSLYGLQASSKMVLLYDSGFTYGMAEGSTSINKTWYLTKGTYYLEVSLEYASYASDTFTVTTKTTAYKESFAESIPNYVEDYPWANTSYRKGKAIKFGRTYTGLIATANYHARDMIDYYKFTVPYTTTINVASSAVGGLKGGSGSLKILDRKGGYEDVLTLGKAYTNVEIEKGTYYLMVMDASLPYTGGKYSVKLTLGPKMSMKVASNSKRTVKLSWSAVAGADKYQIYRSTNYGKSFKLIKTVNKKVRSYVTPSQSLHKYYYYKVRAVDGRAKLPFSTTKYAYFYIKY